jgi:hypothetical protein
MLSFWVFQLTFCELSPPHCNGHGLNGDQQMRLATVADRAKVSVNASYAASMQPLLAHAASDGVAVAHFPHGLLGWSLAVCFHGE